MDWTDEQVKTLRKLCAEGQTFSLIGARLGISRSAAIGKASRLGIRKTSPSSPRPRKPVVLAKPSGKRLLAPHEYYKLRDFEAKMKAAPKQEPKQKVVEGAPAPLNLELTDLTEATCKWPVNDGGPFLFCGHEKESGVPYCSFHQKLAFNGCPPVPHVKLPWRQAA